MKRYVREFANSCIKIIKKTHLLHDDEELVPYIKHIRCMVHCADSGVLTDYETVACIVMYFDQFLELCEKRGYSHGE